MLAFPSRHMLCFIPLEIENIVMFETTHNSQQQSNIAWFSFAGSDLFHHSVQSNMRSQDKRLLQWGHRLGMLLRWVGKTLRRWTTIHSARTELMAMDDRMLNDIGLTRGDIVAATRSTHIPYHLQITNLLSQAGKTFGRWIAVRNARAKLMAMDERMLDDIGLTHGDIEAAISGTLETKRQSRVHELKTMLPKPANVAAIRQRHAA